MRNAKVNALIARFVSLIGAEEAPAVAAHYVGSQNAWYLQKGHSVEQMVADAEKLRMEWATGRNGHRKDAIEADRLAADGAMWGRVEARLTAVKGLA